MKMVPGYEKIVSRRATDTALPRVSSFFSSQVFLREFFKKSRGRSLISGMRVMKLITPPISIRIYQSNISLINLVDLAMQWNILTSAVFTWANACLVSSQK